jgi:hypothetical protein
MPPIPITHVMFTPSVRRVQCVDVYRQLAAIINKLFWHFVFRSNFRTHTTHHCI